MRTRSADRPSESKVKRFAPVWSRRGHRGERDGGPLRASMDAAGRWAARSIAEMVATGPSRPATAVRGRTSGPAGPFVSAARCRPRNPRDARSDLTRVATAGILMALPGKHRRQAQQKNAAPQRQETCHPSGPHLAPSDRRFRSLPRLRRVDRARSAMSPGHHASAVGGITHRHRVPPRDVPADRRQESCCSRKAAPSGRHPVVDPSDRPRHRDRTGRGLSARRTPRPRRRQG